MDTSPRVPETVPLEAGAVLSLVLAGGRGYDEIASLLGLDRAAVRARAHVAAERLVTEPLEPPAATERSQIIDYLLGEQGVSERSRTRAMLTERPVAHAWAGRLTQVLSPLARSALAAVPALEDGAPVASVPASPARVPASAARRRPTVWRQATLLSVAAAAAALIVVVLLTQSGATSVRGGAVRSRTLARFALLPSGLDPSAAGAGAIIRQRSGLLMLLQARGLAPNVHDAYAIWLYSVPGDVRLLGFVSPAVGQDGAFSSGVALPADTARFHALLVTRETSARPGRPGQTVLHSPLNLHP